MLAPLLAALALAAAAQPDRGPEDGGLRARLELSGVPGVGFLTLPAGGTPSRAAQPPACPRPGAGFCDVNWPSAPPAFAPIALPAPWEADVHAGRAQIVL